MKIDKSLILAAGKGTRMGEIGKQLPKVLWPVFEKSILELEVDYLTELECDHIYINSYFYKPQLREFIESRGLGSKATLIEEADEIDIGGGIHNLCQQTGYQGNLLVVNSDQFLMLDRRMLNMAMHNLQTYDGVLFVTTVNSDEGYNQVVKDKNGIFQQVVPNAEIPRDRRIETYIGVSIIKLDRLKPHEGKSKFFESVANPEHSKFFCINVDHLSYWDFGTILLYYEKMFKLLKDQGEFKQFLIRNKAINPDKLTQNSYDCKVTAINLTCNSDLQPQPKSIYLSGERTETDDEKSIVYQGIIQKL